MNNVTFSIYLLQLVLCLLLSTTCSGKRSPCTKFTLVRRSQWSKKEPTTVEIFDNVPDNVIIHDTGVQSQACYYRSKCIAEIQDIQEYDMEELERSDISYNFLIGQDNRVYEGRGWDHVGQHMSGDNTNTIGLAFLGKFTSTRPSDRAVALAKNLLDCGVYENKIQPDYTLQGHRDVRTIPGCPGDVLYGEIKTWDHYPKNV